MAGSFGSKLNPKQSKLANNTFGSEVLKDSPEGSSSQNTRPNQLPKFNLSGILGLNQTVELGKKAEKPVVNFINYLEKEHHLLFDNKQKELQQAIEELRTEVKKLASATDNLEKDVEVAAMAPAIDVSEYQLNFLQRIQKIIAVFRQNISEAGNWLESFNSKKKKKNYFWNTARNKKKGGTEYLSSNEHSAARSVN